MIDYYKVTSQAKATPFVKERKVLSNTNKIFLYVFFGCGIGALIMASSILLISIISIISNNGIPEFGLAGLVAQLFILALFYPFALVIGGIPAILTGWILNYKKPTTYEKLYSFVIGFIICFIFYFIIIPAIAFSFAVIGGITAACTKRLIEKKELGI